MSANTNCSEQGMCCPFGESCADIRSETVELPVGDQDMRPVFQAMATLIVRLEGIHRTEMSARRRVKLLRTARPRVRRIVARMPDPAPISRQTEGGGLVAPTLSQRLYCLFGKNLKLALEDLDRSRHAFRENAAALRWWVVKNQLRFLRRQIEYSVRWDRPYLGQNWQDLHDLILYWINRRAVGYETPDDYRRENDTFDPDTEYKWALLLGLVRDFAPPDKRLPLVDGDMPSWAEQSQLREPGLFLGEFGLFVVEVSKDEPPRHLTGSLSDGFGGWVLEPPKEIRDKIVAPTGDAGQIWKDG